LLFSGLFLLVFAPILLARLVSKIVKYLKK
jgi:hypothetical protein